MLFAHLSDTHLGYRQYNVREREEDFYRAFEEAIDKALEERVDFIIHSGDLFETPRPPTEALLKVLKALRKLRERGVVFYSIPGSHDNPKRRGLPPHALYENLGMRTLRHSNPKVIHEGKVFIAGLEYIARPFKETLTKYLATLSKEAEAYRKRILVLHQALREYLPVEYELELSQLPANFDYYAMGHIHRRILIDYGRGKLGYAGSTEVWSRDEYVTYLKEGKGFYLVDLSSGEPVVHRMDLDSIRPHLIKELNYEPFSLRGELAKLASEVKSLKEKPVVHLRIVGEGYDRKGLRELIAKLLEPLCLTLRIEYLTKEEELTTLKVERIDVRKLLEEELGDAVKAEFAYRLFLLLSKGDLEGARELTEKFYRERWGK